MAPWRSTLVARHAIVQALGLMAQADAADPKRISRFYIDLAAEKRDLHGDAHAWVQLYLIRTMLSPLVRQSHQRKGSSSVSRPSPQQNVEQKLVGVASFLASVFRYIFLFVPVVADSSATDALYRLLP